MVDALRPMRRFDKGYGVRRARTLRRIGAPDPGFTGIGRDLEYALRCRQHGLWLAITRDVYIPSANDRSGEERTVIADSQDGVRLRQKLAAA